MVILLVFTNKMMQNLKTVSTVETCDGGNGVCSAATLDAYCCLCYLLKFRFWLLVWARLILTFFGLALC